MPRGVSAENGIVRFDPTQAGKSSVNPTKIQISCGSSAASLILLGFAEVLDAIRWTALVNTVL